MSFFLKFNDGRSKRRDVRPKSGAGSVRLKFVGQSRFLDFLAEIAEPSMTHAAIHRTISAFVATCYTHELICRSRDGRVERGVVSCRDCPSNIHLARGPDLNSNELVGLLKQMIGIKNRHLR